MNPKLISFITFLKKNDGLYIDIVNVYLKFE